MSEGRCNRTVWGVLHLVGAIALLVLAGTRLQADEASVPQTGSQAFAAHCFSPFMTAERAQDLLVSPGVRVDFYDFDPLFRAAPSPATGRSATPDTDRRCEVAFDGDHGALAARAALAGLEMEGIDQPAPLPDRYGETEGTTLLVAHQLSPRRLVVIHVGTRPGPDGVETFLLVERLIPLEPVQ